MKEQLLTSKKNKRVAIKWGANILLAIPGWVALGGGIHSLQRIAQSFANDINYMDLIDNWLPWVAASFFITGWLITHWMEIALLQRRFTMARVLAVSFLLGIAIIFFWAFPHFVAHPVLQQLDNVFMPLIVSGYFFRYSIFHSETLLLMRSEFFGVR